MRVFICQQLAKLTSASIAQAHPNEMEKFMYKNEAQHARSPHQLRIDHDFAFSEKTGRVNRRSAMGLLR
jgi:hypothetical protein